MTALSRSRFWGRQAVPKMEPRKRRMDIPCTHRRHEKCFSKHPCDAHVSKFIPEHGRPRTVKPNFGWFSAPKNGTLKDNRNISRTELHHRFYCDTTATRICCLFPRALQEQCWPLWLEVAGVSVTENAKQAQQLLNQLVFTINIAVWGSRGGHIKHVTAT